MVKASMPLGAVPPRQFAAYARNIENTYNARNDEQDANGMLWYPHARDLAEGIGRSARIHSGGSLTEGESEMPDHVRGAGILSALSPQNPWGNNVAGAHQLAQFGKASATLKRSVNNARLIREGVHPEDVLNPERTGGTSHKTYNFFRNIADPDESGPVTIDSHAARATLGLTSGHGAKPLAGNELSDARRYNHFADVYRHVANRVGEKPHDLQAKTWLVQSQRQTYDE